MIIEVPRPISLDIIDGRAAVELGAEDVEHDARGNMNTCKGLRSHMERISAFRDTHFSVNFRIEVRSVLSDCDWDHVSGNEGHSMTCHFRVGRGHDNDSGCRLVGSCW